MLIALLLVWLEMESKSPVARSSLVSGDVQFMARKVRSTQSAAGADAIGVGMSGKMLRSRLASFEMPCSCKKESCWGWLSYTGVSKDDHLK